MNLKSLAGVAFVVLIAVGSITAARSQGHDPPGVNPTHFQCYRVSPAQKFKPLAVKLQDQFGSSGVRVITPVLLCAPVAKNGVQPKDTKTHLVCYEEQEGKAADKRVVTTNQFGKELMTVGGAFVLCVPSLKQLP